MNIFTNLRISHKIVALMIGMVAGFIVIGVTYYIQVNMSESARSNEIDAFIFRQKVSELRELELNLLFQSNQLTSDTNSTEQINIIESAVKNKLDEIAQLKSASGYLKKLRNFGNSISEYHDTLAEKAEALALLSEKSASDTRFEVESSFLEIEETLKAQSPQVALDAFTELKLSIYAYLNLSGDIDRPDIQEKLENFSQVLRSESEVKLLPTLVIGTLQSVEILSERALSLVDDIHNANMLLVQKQNNLESIIADLMADSEAFFETSVEATSKANRAAHATMTVIIFCVAMGATVGIYLIYKSIVFPIAHMQSVIRRINRGKTNARVKMLYNDELGDLGRVFNKLFDERIDQLETQSKENEKLNNSIIALIQTLGAIAMKDLTIKVPVSADITGTISDAVNLLTSETANALHEVKVISSKVNSTSEVLQKQSKLVMQFAESEKMQIIATSKALKVLAAAMAEVANQSENADKSATQAIKNTQKAKTAVVEAVNGIRTIRETISETEKRTKRLGDRSQEISGIVNLINTIAERTHILALNASMHAASAGEAGKGFAVVAEEVQRLAENARQSTDEIAAMVNNMRVETSDTVNIMNKLITQVAEGSKTAEQAGIEMEATEKATHELVKTVKHIATQAVQQASIANRVKDRATIIRNFTDKTETQLAEQKISTDNLKQYANSLVETVNVFKLPQDEAPTLVDVSEDSNVSPIKSVV